MEFYGLLFMGNVGINFEIWVVLITMMFLFFSPCYYTIEFRGLRSFKNKHRFTYIITNNRNNCRNKITRNKVSLYFDCIYYFLELGNNNNNSFE